MMVASGEPPFLPVGTDVSAKYRGAFCEAKVKTLSKLVKCKAVIKPSSQVLDIIDEQVKEGPIRVGAVVQVCQDNGQNVEATLTKVIDASMYTVVFDDGDERTLRRTQLCLKGKKHFVESETLDQLPLTHPEHFGTPVMQHGKKGHKRVKSNNSGNESSDIESNNSEEVTSPKKRTYVGRLQDCIGKIVCVDNSEKRKGSWFPALVVLPSAADVPLKTKGHVVVRSFRDSKFLAVLKKDTKEFTREYALKNDEKALKSTIEKALLYFDNHELPISWKKEELLGTDAESDDSDDDTSDDEPSEEKDRFVAQLFKFMDDRGTPINKAPIVSMKDLNLYRLFRVVQNIGGYNRVTNQMKWRLVWSKMGLPASNTASTQIKTAYKKYLHAFEDFYRKLGSTMGTSSRPSRSRHSSGRSLLSFREREKESPRSPKIERKTASATIKEEEKQKEDDDDAKSTKSETKSQNKDPSDSKNPREKAVTRSDKNKDGKFPEQKDRKSTEKGPQNVARTLASRGEKSTANVDKGSNSKTEEKKSDEKKGTNTKTDAKKESVAKQEEQNTSLSSTKSEETKVSPSKSEERNWPREFTRSSSRSEDRKAKEKGMDATKCSPKKGVKGSPNEEKKETKLQDEKKGKGENKQEEIKTDESKTRRGKGDEEADKKSTSKAKKDADGSKSKRTENQDDGKKGKKVEKEDKGKKLDKSDGKGKKSMGKNDEVKGKEDTNEKKVDKHETPTKKDKRVEKDDAKSKKDDTEVLKKGKKREKEDDDKASPSKVMKSDEQKATKLPAPEKDVAAASTKKEEIKKAVPRSAKKNNDNESVKKDAKSSAKDNDDKDAKGEEAKDDTVKRPARKKSIGQKDFTQLDAEQLSKKIIETSSTDEAKDSKMNKTKLKPSESDDADVDDGHETDSSSKQGKYKKDIEYPIGTKLKVKYGRGRNHKVYEAKVVEAEEEHASMSYLVHYNGWNNRYDEWIRKERIVSRVGPPSESSVDTCKKTVKSIGSNSPTTVLHKGIKKLSGLHSPATVLRTHSHDGKVKKPGSPRLRPTRASSSDMPFPIGLPPKSRRSRRMSGHTESSDITSHVSDSDSDDENSGGPEDMDAEEDVDVKPSSAVVDNKTVVHVEEKSVGQPEEKTSDQEPASECPDVEPQVVKTEPMEVCDSVDEIIHQIRNEGEDGDKLVEKIEAKPEIVKDEVLAPPSESNTQEPHSEEPQVKAIKKEVPSEKEADEEASAKPVECAEPDIDLSCGESLEPLVDIRLDSSKDVNVDRKVVVEPVGETKEGALVVAQDSQIRGEVELATGVEKLGSDGLIKDDKETKRLGREDESDKEDLQKREKKKGKKKRRFSQEIPRDEEDETNDAPVEKRKKRKKKTTLDEDLHGEKSKKKTRRKKKDFDEESDATQSDFAEKIAKEMLKLKNETIHVPANNSAVKQQYSVLGIFGGNVMDTRSPQPSYSGGANLLHDLATACEKAAQPRAMSSVVLANTPPMTPERSPTGAGSSASNISPCNEEVQSTKSEHEANIEVARYMAGVGHLEGSESPNLCDTSIVSNCSGGSSGNVPSSESGTEQSIKRKNDEDEEEHVHKKKRKSRKVKTAEKKHSSKQHGSDSDEMPDSAIRSPIHSQASSVPSPTKKVEPRSPRPSKYNFYLDQSEDLERDEKIEILQERIGEIRKIYMQLKAEVAMIDRRRKRARRKEREATAQQTRQMTAVETIEMCS